MNSSTIPFTRHGVPGVRDARLVELFSAAQQTTSTDLALHVRSLHEFNGQLWVTWTDAWSRTQLAPLLDRSWVALGEAGATVHLIPIDDCYDYQEDVINNGERDL